MKRNPVHDNWLTPKYYYDQINQRFNFDHFDPCPVSNDITKFDGLKIPWAQRTFFNPPYCQNLKEKFLTYAHQQSQLGKLAVGLVPVSTSTKIFHKLILPYARIEFIEGRLPFEGLDNQGNWVNPHMGTTKLPNVPPNAPQIKRSGQQDLMLVIFGIN